MKKRTTRILGAGVLAGALALGACGGEAQPGVSEIGDGGSGSGSGSASASASASASRSGSATASGETASVEGAPAFPKSEADSVVRVTTKEWTETAEPVTVKGPKVYFEVFNEGEDAHEMAVTSAGATDEEGAYGDTGEIGPGAMKPLALELPPGTYQIACFIVEEEEGGEMEDHFKLGMRSDIEVQ